MLTISSRLLPSKVVHVGALRIGILQLIAFVLALLPMLPASAQTVHSRAAETWTSLGRFAAPEGQTRFRMTVRPGSERFTSVGIRVLSGQLDTANIVVEYTDGSRAQTGRDRLIRAGEPMLVLDASSTRRRAANVTVFLRQGASVPANTRVELGGFVPLELKEDRQEATARKRAAARASRAPAAQPPEVVAPSPPPFERAPPHAAAQPGSGGSAPTIGARTSADSPPPVAAARPPEVAFSKEVPERSASGRAPVAASAPRSASPAPAPVVDENIATAVSVFFGTDRKREADRSKFNRQLAHFGAEAGPLTLGRAIVSVPKEGREAGVITRPEWDLFFTTIQLRREDPARDFVLLNVDVMDRTSFVAAARAHSRNATTFKNQAFVFVHGYRVSFDDALYRAAQITHDMGFDGMPFLYSWPSSAGLMGYVNDERRALGAREPLRAFLEMVVKEAGAEKVHLIAHSMGAQALLEVLRDIRNIGGDAIVSRPMFNEVILAAPDITRDNFQQIVARVRGLATGITLYASANDRALSLSQKLSGASAGHVQATGPIVLEGIDSIDVTAASTDFFSLNHSTFADRAQLIEDMRLLLSQSLRPPNERISAYTPVPGSDGLFWRFLKVP